MALSPGAGIKAQQRTTGVGAPSIARPTFFFTRAVFLGCWRIRTSGRTPAFWHCSKTTGLKKSEVEGPK
eukprot:6223642-Pyramimonas_sp.AAC.1